MFLCPQQYLITLSTPFLFFLKNERTSVSGKATQRRFYSQSNPSTGFKNIKRHPPVASSASSNKKVSSSQIRVSLEVQKILPT
ncbi:hypothetical protein P8452_46258 [Trifolium repens]|nr:hypothetical protein P8452_46258 [Trifolium repens]